MKKKESSVRATYWVYPSHKKALEKWSKKEHMSQSDIVRYLITKWIETNK